MNKYFLFFLMFINLFINITICFEYSPYDILTYKKANLSLICMKDKEDLRIIWLTFSCNLSSNNLIYEMKNYVSNNSILNVSKFENNCSYFQCIMYKKNQVFYEKMFRIVILESSNYKNSLTYFDYPFKPLINIKFTTDLKETLEYRLEWLLWDNKNIYNIHNYKYFSVYNNSIEFSVFYKKNIYGLIPCLINIKSNNIYNCGKSSFVHNINLGKQKKIIYVNLNDYIILYCNNVSGSNVKWYKDGYELMFGHRILYNHFYIVISNFVLSDSGYYQCMSEMPYKLPYYLSIFLVYFNDDKVNFHIPTVINQKKNSTFILPCKNPNSNEIPEFMLWTFNVLKQLSHASTFRTPSINFELFVSNANLNDNGFYQCLVYVSGKLKIFSFNINFKVEVTKNKDEAHILKRRSVGEVGEITNFKFKAFTNNINLSWSPPIALVKKYIIKWGKMYPGPQKQIIDGKENRFTIPSLRPETTYFINVVAETDHGLTKPILRPITTKEENKEIFLTIPLNLKLLEVGDNWSKISWDIRNNDEINDLITDKLYQVEYCPVRSQRGQKVYKNTTSTSLKILDVKPATTYEFAVRTCLSNSSKCSDWSMVQEFTTLGTKPGDSPQHLTLSTIQLNVGSSENSKSNHMFAVQVSWQPPKDPNGDIKNYLILVTAEKQLEISNWGERTVSGKTLNTVIDRLDLNRYYYFRIRCSNEYGKSPLSPIRIFKTPDEHGKNVGPIYLSKEYFDPMEINEELKLSRSIERGTDDFPDIISGEKKVLKSDRLGISSYKWWIIIGIVVGAALIFILILFFFIAIKCRNENANFEFNSKTSKKQLDCKMKYGIDKKEKVKFVNKGPILTTPDLFRHTKDQNCHSNYLELEDRNESPNSFSSNKAFPGLNHNQSFPSQNNYRNIPGHYTPPGLIHQQNIVMTTSQLTSSSNERHFYQVPFLHHVGHNSFNVFANSAPRVNAAASDFNSINVPSPISDFSDFTSSQATILYDTSTAKSSGGKSSLSGSGSYNNGLGNKSVLTNEPILEAYSSEKNNEIIFNESNNQGNSVSKAFSSEELCQEMANLEGLMKDLNNITQKEFEC